MAIRFARGAALICAAVATAMPLHGAHAANDGNSLLKQCSTFSRIDSSEAGNPTGTELMSAGFCLGLMQGIRHTNRAYGVVSKTLFCEPEHGVTNGQAARVVTKYLQEHPEQLHESDSGLAMFALMEAFPCNNKSPAK